MLASKVTKRNATNYTAELNRRGIAEVFAFLRDSGSRVLYGKYETQDEAYSMQRQLMRQEEFKDCWVMEMTNRE